MMQREVHNSCSSNLADYDVARDERIVISEGPDQNRATGQTNVVIHWLEEIRARVPR